MSEEVRPVGRVTHYFDRIGVAVIHLEEPLAVGDWIHLYGQKTNFIQQVESMQVNHVAVHEGAPGEDVAVLVVDKVHKGDYVYPYVAEQD